MDLIDLTNFISVICVCSKLLRRGHRSMVDRYMWYGILTTIVEQFLYLLTEKYYDLYDSILCFALSECVFECANVYVRVWELQSKQTNNNNHHQCLHKNDDEWHSNDSADVCVWVFEILRAILKIESMHLRRPNYILTQQVASRSFRFILTF